jgi:hypothetical protein
MTHKNRMSKRSSTATHRRGLLVAVLAAIASRAGALPVGFSQRDAASWGAPSESGTAWKPNATLHSDERGRQLLAGRRLATSEEICDEKVQKGQIDQKAYMSCIEYYDKKATTAELKDKDANGEKLCQEVKVGSAAQAAERRTMKALLSTASATSSHTACCNKIDQTTNKIVGCAVDVVTKQCRLAANVKDENNGCLATEAKLMERESVTAELAEGPGFLKTGSRESGSTSYASKHALETMQPYPAIDYLGVGYDMLHGNPAGDEKFMIDPGFRQPIRQMDYQAGWLTRDGQYKVPKGAYAWPLKSCQRSTEFEDIASAESYASSLAVDAAVEASYKGAGFGAAFSASAGFKKTKNEDTQTSDYRFSSKSYCNKYFAGWLRKVPEAGDLTPQFARSAVQAIESLPKSDASLSSMSSADAKAHVFGLLDVSSQTAKAREVWFELFRVYGTHFVTQLTLGGKMIYTKFVSKEAVAEAAGLDANADLSVAGKYGGFKAAAKISMAYARQDSSQDSSEASKERVTIMGGVPSGDATSVEGFAAWADSVTLNPMPVKYQMAPLSELAMSVALSDGAYDDDDKQVHVDADCSGHTGEAKKVECEAAAATAAAARATELKEREAAMRAKAPQTASLFAIAYEYFLDDLSRVGQQEAFLDTATQELDLNGGLCMDDRSVGTLTAFPKKKHVDIRFPTGGGEECKSSSGSLHEWSNCRNQDLEGFCYEQCFQSRVGMKWAKVPGSGETSRPKDRHGTPVGADLTNQCLVDKLKRELDGSSNHLSLSDAEFEACSLHNVKYNDVVKVTKPGSRGQPSTDHYWRPDLTSANVAMEFIPSKGQEVPSQAAAGSQPECRCYSKCPRVEYDSGSVDKTSNRFGRKLKIKCNPGASTSHLCAPAAYTPWPRPFEHSRVASQVAREVAKRGETNQKLANLDMPPSKVADATWGVNSAAAWYMASPSNVDLGGKKWYDLSGKGNHAALLSDAGVENGLTLDGDVTSLGGWNANGVDFGDVIKSKFTICSLTRWTPNMGHKNKILQCKRKQDSTFEWFHGHDDQFPGVAKYGKYDGDWQTEKVSPVDGANQEYNGVKSNSDWVVMCGTNNRDPALSMMTLVNGVDVSKEGANAGSGDCRLGVNTDVASATRSGFRIAEVMVWDRGLTRREMFQASDYLLNKISYNYLNVRYHSTIGGNTHGTYSYTDHNSDGHTFWNALKWKDKGALQIDAADISRATGRKVSSTEYDPPTAQSLGQAAGCDSRRRTGQAMVDLRGTHYYIAGGHHQKEQPLLQWQYSGAGPSIYWACWTEEDLKCDAARNYCKPGSGHYAKRCYLQVGGSCGHTKIRETNGEKILFLGDELLDH